MLLWEDVVKASEHPTWVNALTNLVEVNLNEPTYHTVDSKIPYAVSKIFEVRNAKLYAKFLLKKEQYYSNSTILELFHDTEIHNIPSIMESNLDWRRVVRSKYGEGVSFATTAEYANKYSNGFNREKAMIIADVLTLKSQTHLGSFPTSDIDTTISRDRNVIVKYCDDEFYPKYVVYYTGPTKTSRYHNADDNYDDSYYSHSDYSDNDYDDADYDHPDDSDY